MILTILASFLLTVALAAPRVNSHPSATRNPQFLHPLLRQDTCPAILRPDCPLQSTSQRQVHHTKSKGTYLPGSMHATSVDGLTPRVVNGNDVLSDRLRAMAVFIFIPEGGGNATFCSGSLISSRWVLSVAQCDYVEGTQAVIGARRVDPLGDSIGSDGGQIVPVRRGIIHPEYNESDLSGRANDIALFELTISVVNPRFMALNTNPSIPERGSITRTFGYGISRGGEVTSAYFLRQIDIPVFPIDECNSVFEGTIIPERSICVGYRNRECGICNGDGGGPVFQYDEDDNPVQIGIVARGPAPECARPGVPSINTRVSAFIEWVRQNGADFTQGNPVNSVFETESDNGNMRCDDEVDGDDGNENGTGLPIAVIVGSIAGALVLIFIVIGGIIWFRNGGIFCMRQEREERREKNAMDSTVPTS